jgi:KRAB domain-containing zinc finger protein
MRCQLCPKAFRDRANLASHVRRAHVGIYFECIYCSKRFAGRIHMKKHLYMHLGRNIYACSECPEYFKTRSL